MARVVSRTKEPEGYAALAEVGTQLIAARVSPETKVRCFAARVRHVTNPAAARLCFAWRRSVDWNGLGSPAAAFDRKFRLKDRETAGNSSADWLEATTAGEKSDVL